MNYQRMDVYGSKTHVNFITITSSVVDLFANSDFKQHFEHFSQSTFISGRFPRGTSMHDWYEKKKTAETIAVDDCYTAPALSFPLIFRNCANYIISPRNNTCLPFFPAISTPPIHSHILLPFIIDVTIVLISD